MDEQKEDAKTAQAHKTIAWQLMDRIRSMGIPYVFMGAGQMIDPLMYEITKMDGITGIVAAHEGGAAFMADGYARASGKLGVCMCIGGPGVAYMVGAITSAFVDESPILVIVGQIETDKSGLGTFQDASPAGSNEIRYLDQITALSMEIPSVAVVKHHFNQLVNAAIAHRRPVSMSIPVQIQEKLSKPLWNLGSHINFDPPRIIDRAKCGSIVDLMRSAERITFLVGNGSSLSKAEKELLAFSERYCIPVATTLRAKGFFPENHPNSLGVFGYAGTNHATEAVLSLEGTTRRNDLLIVLGARLNQRNSMKWHQKMRPKFGICQIDINSESVGKYYPVDVEAVGDVRTFLEWLSTEQDESFDDRMRETIPIRQSWLAEIRSVPRHQAINADLAKQNHVHPALLMQHINKVMPAETMILADSGAHRAFAGHYLQSNSPNSYLTATNYGPMGWAIPAAIGAKLARPDVPCLAITGDGCMLMHGIELQTASFNNICVIIVVVNNSALGNVYLRAVGQVQYPSAPLMALQTHDWVLFSKSLGGDGRLVRKESELDAALTEALAYEKGPFVIDVRCPPNCPTPIGSWKDKKNNSVWAPEEYLG